MKDMSDFALLDVAKAEIVSRRVDSPVNGAFEEILHRYERLIYHVARRYFSIPEDAMDASQESVIKIYKALPRVVLEPEQTLKAWICTVTARTCLDTLRKQKIQTVELSEEITPGTAPSAEESAIANENTRELLAAIKKLPKDQRMILILRDMQGLSYDELASALNITIGTVKSRLSRARTALKKLMGRSQ